VVVALAGTLLFVAGHYSYLLVSTLWLSLLNMLNQFPFQMVDYYAPGWEAGWGIQVALVDTLILSAITVFLFVLTIFVVPLLVLEKKSLKEAVSGSFALMKNIWGEVAACVLGLGMVLLFSALLMFLLFQGVTAIVALENSVTWYPGILLTGQLWFDAAGFLYVLALSSITFVVATVGGIATLDLYNSAKTGQMPGSAETTGEVS
jgi:hypothetical protein